MNSLKHPSPTLHSLEIISLTSASTPLPLPHQHSLLTSLHKAQPSLERVAFLPWLAWHHSDTTQEWTPVIERGKERDARECVGKWASAAARKCKDEDGEGDAGGGGGYDWKGYLAQLFLTEGHKLNENVRSFLGPSN
jgi:hypothetical protein